VALMIANFAVPTAKADESVNSRDYQAVTARVQGGGEGVYVLDNRTGLVAIFTYDPTQRVMKPRDVRAISDSFK
jgi:hypothetical protein